MACSAQIERDEIVAWLRQVAQARDDRADPEWAIALSEAADFINCGEHLRANKAEDCAHEIEAELTELAGMACGASCPLCCGPVDDDGMTLAAQVDRNPEGEKPQALSAKHESPVAKRCAKTQSPISGDG